MSELSKEQRNELWTELKSQWSVLKGGSGAGEKEKGTARARINEIQESLGLQKTDWAAPRQPKDSIPGNTVDNDKLDRILGTILDKFRHLNERLDKIENTMRGATP